MRQVRVVFLLLLLAAPVFAAAGRVKGTVKDTYGKPLEKVLITIDSTGDVKQKFTARTNEKGEYIHIGVPLGTFRITPSLEGYRPAQYSYFDVKVSLSNPAVADFVLQKIEAQAARAASKEEASEPSEAKRGLELLQQGNLDEGIAALQKALESNPGSAAIHYNIGVALERKKQSQEAQKHFQEAIKLDPNMGEAYLALGNSYLAEKKFDTPAIEALVKAGELMPGSYAAFYNLGVCYANIGKYAEAEQAFRKATEIDPKEPVAHYQLGLALLGQSKNAEAKTAFQKYLELNPTAADRQEVEDLLKSME